jgi:small subunit ribosomal protein S6
MRSEVLAANVYEGMLILDTNRYGRDPDAVSAQVPDLIQRLGGEILVSRLWEERRLAYSIKGQRKGTYWLMYFRLDANQLATLRRECEINENLLRFLYLKIDPRIVDALVAHAQSAPVVVTAGGEEPAVAAVAVAVEEVEVPEDLEAVEEE